MKSQEQRITDAIEAARGAVGCHLLTTESVRQLVGVILEAADHEPPKWPTDESVKTIWLGGWVEGTEERRLRTREAFMADPIIKAAIEYRDTGTDTAMNGVARAVNEAGL